MAAKRLEIKVGIFVLVCLVLVGALVVSFSKGLSFVHTTYDVKLRTTDVGGIKRGAAVLMSGVSIGNVTRIALASDGKSVVLTLHIDEQYRIYRDASFQIEQAGLLGDQYVSVVPTENKGQPLNDGEEVSTAPASDFKQMLRSAAGLIEKLDEAASVLQGAIGRVDKVLLNDTNLNAVARAVTNFEGLSTRAVGTLDRIDMLVASNAPSLHGAVTNLDEFTVRLRTLGDELNMIVVTNKEQIARAVKNVESASVTANELVTDLKAGKGMVGGLLRDDQMKAETQALVSNLTTLSIDLGAAAARLNRDGLWRFLWRPSPEKTKPSTGKTPSP